jgi:hypothetical protein
MASLDELSSGCPACGKKEELCYASYRRPGECVFPRKHPPASYPHGGFASSFKVIRMAKVGRDQEPGAVAGS